MSGGQRPGSGTAAPVSARPASIGVGAPVAAGIAAMAVATWTWALDPSQPGTAFVPCPFHALTGWWCPGCGMTRALHAALHGRFGAALSFNVFLPAIVAIAAWGWWAWVARARGHPLRRTPGNAPAAGWVAFGVIAVLYGVLRNLPAFAWLAP